MTPFDPILEYAVQHPGQTAGAIATAGAAVFHGLKTRTLPLGRLPYRYLRDLLGELQETYYSKQRPRGVPGVIVNATPDELETALRDAHFEGTDFSHEYESAVWDLRRPVGTKRHPESGRTIPMELHVRAFELSDGRTLLLSHFEASRYEAPGVHKRGTMLSWDVGQGMVRTLFANEVDYEFESITSERDADIQVVS